MATIRPQEPRATAVGLAPQDRPREKLERNGPAALGDNELLALLLGHGTAGASALSVAAALLTASGGVHGLTRMSRDEIAAVPGLGAALASRVQAGLELGRRTLTHRPPARPQIRTPEDAAVLLLPQYGAHPVERAGVVLLDARHRVLGVRLISVGSIDTSLVHPREVFRPAVTLGAAAIMLFHNHPSGDPTPSPEDYALTRRIVQAGAVVGIRVIDHVILADARYCSVRLSGGL
jgi:DNA repair protein RadC